MLGHGSKKQSDQENVFKVIVETIASVDSVVDTLVRYSSRYPILLRLRQIVGAENLFRFLGIFGDLTIKVPKPGEDYELTYLPEIQEFFGDDIVVRFIEEFRGQTAKIPPLHLIANVVRDVDIYVKINQVRHASTVRKLAKHYQLTRHEVWWVYRRVASTINPKEKVDELLDFTEGDD